MRPKRPHFWGTCARRHTFLNVQVRNSPDSGKDIAKARVSIVRQNLQEVGCGYIPTHWQISGLTSRNHISLCFIYNSNYCCMSKAGGKSACDKQAELAYSGSLPSYMMLSSPYTCPQFLIGMDHFFVASNVLTAVENLKIGVIASQFCFQLLMELFSYTPVIRSG